jgi:putative peptide zinc metalloprotease protein
MVIASVATLLFNGNPLLRFDGYYILSDLIEIPNLADRSRQFLFYVVKRYVWGVRGPAGESGAKREAAWLAGYAIASTLFRIFVCVKILLMLCERFFLIGTALAAMAVVTWVLLPAGRFVRYLLADGELSRVRGRALATTAAVLGGLLALLAFVPVPDRWRVEGVAEPARLAHVHAGVDGIVRRVVPSASRARLGGPAGVLVRAENADLRLKQANLRHEREILLCRLKTAREGGSRDKRYLALAQILQRDLADLDRQAKVLADDIAALDTRAPFDGTWHCPRADRLIGVFVPRGERLGTVATLDKMLIRAKPGQRLAGMLIDEADRRCEIRLKGRPSVVFEGDWEPPPAGGTDGPDRTGPKRFDIRITPRDTAGAALLAGQKVLIRFRLPPRPLIRQWWRSLRQLAQARLGR